jgi:2-polyprenyl-3-methyl-5-hydroxy-6-metoxy-1,4-benzoquinol methylase
MTKPINNPQPAVDVFNQCATAYQEKFMDVDLYNDSFDWFCYGIITENATVLELACGPGNITRYLLKKRHDFKILGTDLAPNMIELAKINNPTAEFQLMDCRDIAKINKKYDAIMCGFALPYLSKEEAIQLISDASKILNPNGVLYLSTMIETEDDKSGLKSSSSGEFQTYIHYHQTEYLVQALEDNGFKINHLQHQNYPTTDGTKTIDLLIIAQK